MTTTFYRITLPYAVAGVIVHMGKVVSAPPNPPIFRWCRYKTVEQLKTWVQMKGGTIEEMPEVLR